MAPHEKPPFRVEALLPAPASSYFLERDSAAFRSLLSKVLKIGQLEFQDCWHEGSSTFVKIVTKPEFGSWVPKSVASQLQSSNLEFIDVIEYNPAFISASPYRIFVRTESPFLKDKLDVRMTMTIEEAEGGAACRQILEGHIRVKMFGVGRIVEGIVKDSLQNTYKKLPEIVRRWQLFREEALRSGDGRQLLLGRPPVGCEVQWIRQEVLQILKEPLCEDGTVSPDSALSPPIGASEASDDSPSTVNRMQQAAAAAGTAAVGTAAAAGAAAVGAAATAASTAAAAVGTAAAGVVAAAGAAAGAPPAAAASTAEEAELVVPVALREASIRQSLTSVYYDASDVLLDDVSSAGMPAGAAAAGQPAPPPWEAAAPAAVDEETAPQPLPERSPLTAAALAAASLVRSSSLSRRVMHRRTVSTDSAASGAETPLGEDGQPLPKQPASRRFWRRFNRDYGEWETYWDEVGVEQEELPDQPETAGVVGRALQSLEGLMRDTYYSTSILVALFLMRHGWLRVEPDADADPHDEAARQHYGHRHARNASNSSATSSLQLDNLWPAAGSDGTVAVLRRKSSTAARAAAAASEAGELDAVAAQQGLSLVAQEVFSRMVSGSRKVAKAPARAVAAAGSGLAAAGTTVRQASMTGARAVSSVLRPRSAGSDLSRAGEGSSGGSQPEQPAQAAPVGLAAAALPPLPPHQRARLSHRKTMSLDTGAAAAAQEAAAAALLRHREGGVAPAHVSPSKELQRRGSNLAELAAMQSMQRSENHVRAPSRFACFTVCGWRPAVKDE
ncbi:hypothetical protein C2E21_2158 [Chlorella sorokiniana]|uniref:Uncharacterized protein n=1 Tax=Chlorella sorokiniana TaxID=3076 RepID=A0A2P6TZE6_CHLSO|nr:hypothetical protein C2E21_2158 [Chlorella sorokiniana]|eukprot:PRW59437.1 hypothetical protein C2E21_2158 [Chlorella sorokiniana]